MVKKALDWCLDAVVGWMRANKLNVNPGKTKALWVSGSQVWEVSKLPAPYGVSLSLNVKVHSLEVLLDSVLSLVMHSAPDGERVC